VEEEEVKRKVREETRQPQQAQVARERSIWEDVKAKGRELRKQEESARIRAGEKPTDQMRQGLRMRL